VKIGPIDPEIICLKLKKEEINASKIYSPIGRFAKLAKLFFILSFFNDLIKIHIIQCGFKQLFLRIFLLLKPVTRGPSSG